MSYILEALKKLEQKRQQEGTPNLLTLQGDATKVRKKRSVWPYIVSGIALLNVIIFAVLFWIGPWKNSGQPLPSQPKVARESIAPQSATTPSGEKRGTDRRNEERCSSTGEKRSCSVWSRPTSGGYTGKGSG